jgi:hypothetical protein
MFDEIVAFEPFIWHLYFGLEAKKCQRLTILTPATRHLERVAG